jgi:hypothetical protein
MPKSGGDTRTKKSEMSGSEQALEVTIVDVEKARKFRCARRDRFCPPRTHGSGARQIIVPRYGSVYLCALFCSDHAYHYERILNQRPFVVAKQPSSETSESFFGNVFTLLKQTFQEWLQDKAPQLGAALAYLHRFLAGPAGPRPTGDCRYPLPR